MTRTDAEATLVEATDLLNIELPDPRWRDQRHLEWLYHHNPLGPGIYGFRREGDRLDAHYAVIPQEYRTADGPIPMMFSLNAVTRSVAQRQGHFWSIAEEIYARARAEHGAHGIIGVSNDNSTPPVVKRLDFRLMGPLPVKVLVPRRPDPDVSHNRIDDEFAASGTFRAALEGLDHPVDWGWRNRYTPEYLQWRLTPPNVEPFCLHLSEDLFGVSVPSHAGPLRAAVVLKLLPRRPVTAPLVADRFVAAIGVYHRAPVIVYAGFNARVRVRGLRPPRRWQPSPLNLIFRSLTERAPKRGFRLDTFEFLDMDAY
jgi:hypothetical protein